MIKLLIKSLILTCLAAFDKALAHTSEQGFVLLLPTDVYISAGVITVAVTVLLLAILPADFTTRLFASRRLLVLPPLPALAVITSLLSLAILLFLLFVGYTGSHDPLKNLLPLSIWTIWWIGFVCVQGVAGNLWHWVNPWTGLYHCCAGFNRVKPPQLQLPPLLGHWPGVCLFILFSCFALADPAPEDPARLSTVVLTYWLFTFTGMLLFGADQWLSRCECFTILLRQMAKHSAVSTRHHSLQAGIPGWQLTHHCVNSVSMAVFILVVLAVGSFDGLNETFWWLGQINVNPLEFPGRSAVVMQTVGGLLVSILLLLAVFSLCIGSGVLLANRYTPHKVQFTESFTQLSVAILPIALAYHFAHFLTTFLVNAQYALASATDPLLNGRDLLGLGRFYVTTGFFNTRDTVRTIWLTQAFAVVAGHVLSVLIAHSIATRLWREPRNALLSQMPLAVFMIFYTLLGLWLLAAPRGA